MNFFNKGVVFFITLLFYGTDIFCYTYTIRNKTGKDLRVQLVAKVERFRYASKKLNKNPQLINDREKYIFSFKDVESKQPLCLQYIMIATKETGKWGRMAYVKIFDKSTKEAESYSIPSWQDTCRNRDYTLYRIFYSPSTDRFYRPEWKIARGPDWKEIIYINANDLQGYN